MRTRLIAAIIVLLTILAVAVATRGVGLTARRAPWLGEARLAGLVRAWTLPAEYRRMTNPLAPTAAALRDGMAHSDEEHELPRFALSASRHRPQITPEEVADMEQLNPKSAADIEREREIQDFLQGGT